jgi:hypothetical protein
VALCMRDSEDVDLHIRKRIALVGRAAEHVSIEGWV